MTHRLSQARQLLWTVVSIELANKKKENRTSIIWIKKSNNKMKDQNQKARAVFFNEAGGAEVLKVNDIDMPVPGDDEVLINVKSIGLNRADIMYRMGMYFESPVFPAKLGYEAAGLVEVVGAG